MDIYYQIYTYEYIYIYKTNLSHTHIYIMYTLCIICSIIQCAMFWIAGLHSNLSEQVGEQRWSGSHHCPASCRLMAACWTGPFASGGKPRQTWQNVMCDLSHRLISFQIQLHDIPSISINFYSYSSNSFVSHLVSMHPYILYHPVMPNAALMNTSSSKCRDKSATV